LICIWLIDVLISATSFSNTVALPIKGEKMIKKIRQLSFGQMAVVICLMYWIIWGVIKLSN